ncbi:hypothetical protein KUL25_10710 [Rhodobacteraceae bacterium N5(2021)]|uniref:Uncharacterized protein n=1 Tax=Gymnodinialimonas phycosphaerae TaxID=2841589 RepID=A0A975TSH3_9RHOB|nr:hypothetical protein [Gymnodinialimonas phycosphaerae]MBY4893235.1 hypothetical protein [Gymnodinialimonas phycosphaerae]
MFYTRIGSFIAATVFVLSVFSIVFAVGLLWSGSAVEAIQQRSGMTPGQAIDRGIYGIVFSVALGILTEISGKVGYIEEKLPESPE